jgi:hypothetical protein
MVDLVSRNHAEQVEASWQIPERRVDECLGSLWLFGQHENFQLLESDVENKGIQSCCYRCYMRQQYARK